MLKDRGAEVILCTPTPYFEYIVYKPIQAKLEEEADKLMESLY